MIAVDDKCIVHNNKEIDANHTTLTIFLITNNKMQRTTHKTHKTHEQSPSSNNNNSDCNKPRNHIVKDATSQYTFTYKQYGQTKSVHVNQTPQEESE
jgi:hypothetical protein